MSVAMSVAREPKTLKESGRNGEYPDRAWGLLGALGGIRTHNLLIRRSIQATYLCGERLHFKGDHTDLVYRRPPLMSTMSIAMSVVIH
jgi:hypothetical protein